ncbi:basic proline-rich protein-like [Oryctolagus cuniculus]|uniref:basic proline-rich protein-like n=1 Tax=Oryctolagus cuniculus TaxID=9986 RepID=UPI0038799D7F
MNALPPSPRLYLRHPRQDRFLKRRPGSRQGRCGPPGLLTLGIPNPEPRSGRSAHHVLASGLATARLTKSSQVAGPAALRPAPSHGTLSPTPNSSDRLQGGWHRAPGAGRGGHSGSARGPPPLPAALRPAPSHGTVPLLQTPRTDSRGAGIGRLGPAGAATPAQPGARPPLPAPLRPAPSHGTLSPTPNSSDRLQGGWHRASGAGRDGHSGSARGQTPAPHRPGPATLRPAPSHGTLSPTPNSSDRLQGGWHRAPGAGRGGHSGSARGPTPAPSSPEHPGVAGTLLRPVSPQPWLRPASPRRRRACRLAAKISRPSGGGATEAANKNGGGRTLRRARLAERSAPERQSWGRGRGQGAGGARGGRGAGPQTGPTPALPAPPRPLGRAGGRLLGAAAFSSVGGVRPRPPVNSEFKNSEVKRRGSYVTHPDFGSCVPVLANPAHAGGCGRPRRLPSPCPRVDPPPVPVSPRGRRLPSRVPAWTPPPVPVPPCGRASRPRAPAWTRLPSRVPAWTPPPVPVSLRGSRLPSPCPRVDAASRPVSLRGRQLPSRVLAWKPPPVPVPLCGRRLPSPCPRVDAASRPVSLRGRQLPSRVPAWKPPPVPCPRVEAASRPRAPAWTPPPVPCPRVDAGSLSLAPVPS